MHMLKETEACVFHGEGAHLTDAEKGFDEIESPFTIKAHNKLANT